MKRILATMLFLCVVVSGMVMLSSCEKNEFTAMIPGFNAFMDKVEELTHVHKITLVEQVNPTCNDAGTKEYRWCRVIAFGRTGLCSRGVFASGGIAYVGHGSSQIGVGGRC